MFVLLSDGAGLASRQCATLLSQAAAWRTLLDAAADGDLGAAH
ncbi:MAG TPA: hypothetical protein VN714_14225 [Trebonia sp.]|nr:hypothetical protein [Trebonia sp.]